MERLERDPEYYFCIGLFLNIFADHFGEVVERSITAVLKTVELQGSGGSNPSLSAETIR